MKTIKNGTDAVTARTFYELDWIDAVSFKWDGNDYEVVSTHRDGYIAVCKNGYVRWYRLTYNKHYLWKVNKTCVSTAACYYTTNEFVRALFDSAMGNNSLARLCDVIIQNVRPAKPNYYDGYSPVDMYVRELMKPSVA